MFRYIWLGMLLGGYIGWGIYAFTDIIKSHMLNMPCEELSSCFIYTTAAALFIASFITWIIQYV